MLESESDNDIDVIPYRDLTRHVIGSRAETHLEFPEGAASAVRAAAQAGPAAWATFIANSNLPSQVKAWNLSSENPLRENVRLGFAAIPI